MPAWHLTVGVVLLLPWFVFWLSPSWPPVWLERYDQRRQVAAAVEQAGGWEAVRRECAAFLAQSGSDDLFLKGPGMPGLTPKLAALQLREFWYLSPKYCATPNNPHPGFGVVTFKFFGLHRTGWHSEPNLCVALAVGPEANLYNPQINLGCHYGVTPQRSRQLAPGIVEFW